MLSYSLRNKVRGSPKGLSRYSIHKCISLHPLSFLFLGVDLANIDKTGGVGRQEMLDCITELKNFAQASNTVFNTPETILYLLEKIDTLCSKTELELGKRNQNLLVDKEGIESYEAFLTSFATVDKAVLVKVLNSLDTLSKINIRIRDYFEHGAQAVAAGSKRLVAVIESMSNDENSDDLECQKVLAASLSLARSVSKTENIKVSAYLDWVT